MFTLNIDGLNAYIYPKPEITTLTLTYLDDKLQVPFGGFYKRADDSSITNVVLIPTPTALGYSGTTSVMSHIYVYEFLTNGDLSIVGLDVLFTPTMTDSSATYDSSTTSVSSTTGTGTSPTSIPSSINTNSLALSNTLTITSGSMSKTVTNVTTKVNEVGETIIETDVVVYCPEEDDETSTLMETHYTTVCTETNSNGYVYTTTKDVTFVVTVCTETDSKGESYITTKTIPKDESSVGTTKTIPKDESSVGTTKINPMDESSITNIVTTPKDEINSTKIGLTETTLSSSTVGQSSTQSLQFNGGESILNPGNFNFILSAFFILLLL